MRRKRLFFLGPLPPPVHGFSAINAELARELARHYDVTVFNRAAPLRLGAGRLSRVTALLSASVVLWCGFIKQIFLRRPAALYVGVSGGGGQWIDLAFVAAAKLARVPMVLHHHSFAYLNKPNLVSHLLMFAARGATQVVLCEAMGDLLAKRYQVKVSDKYVLSNAAFVEQNDQRIASSRGVLRVGFLSNISEEKGIFDFFAVISALSSAGIAVEARIAGPLAQNIVDRFASELSRVLVATHVGPVYGDAKRRFLAELDILLFPTRYVNEAQPVTVFEAMSAGLVVFASKRSCIDEMIAADAGKVVSIGDFSEVVVENIIWLEADRESLFQAQLCAQVRFRALREASRAQMEALVSRWTATPAEESDALKEDVAR